MTYKNLLHGHDRLRLKTIYTHKLQDHNRPACSYITKNRVELDALISIITIHLQRSKEEAEKNKLKRDGISEDASSNLLHLSILNVPHNALDA